MYKAVILFQQSFTNPEVFTRGWQKFLGMVEQMPGLQRESVCDVDQLIVGPPHMKFRKIHELYFNSREELDAALQSEAGQKAGQWLHQFTQGQFSILIGTHQEATPDHFKRETPAPEPSP